MTLRRFVDVAASLLADEFSRHGGSLLAALDNVKRLGLSDEEIAALDAPSVQTAEGNANAMNALTSMMAGVKGAPV